MALETRGMTSNLEIEGARRAEVSQKAGGLSVEWRLTKAGEDPLEALEYVLRDSQISNSDGSVVFELKGAEVPEGWSQLLIRDFNAGSYTKRTLADAHAHGRWLEWHAQ